MPRAIGILGPHRSGTSVTTRALQLAGVDLGEPSRLQPGGRSNPDGFWELADVIELHDDLLADLGRSWDTALALPDRWHQLPATTVHRDRLRAIVETTFAGRELWGWKDPRTCLTLPLWTAVLDELGVEPGFALVLRDPLDVARSLARRDGRPLAHGLGIWFHHMLAALAGTRGRTRAVIEYENLLRERATGLLPLCEALGLPEPPGAARAQIDALIRPPADRPGSAPSQLAAAVPAPCLELYRALREVAADASRWPQVEAVAETLGAGWRDFSRMIEYELDRCRERRTAAETAFRELSDHHERSRRAAGGYVADLRRNLELARREAEALRDALSRAGSAKDDDGATDPSPP